MNRSITAYKAVVHVLFGYYIGCDNNHIEIAMALKEIERRLAVGEDVIVDVRKKEHKG